MSDIKRLNEKIEEKRKEMYAAYQKDPNDPAVLKLSQSLDVLLNQLTKLLREHSDKRKVR